MADALRPEEIGALCLMTVEPTDRALAGWSQYGSDHQDHRYLERLIEHGGPMLISMLHSYASNSSAPRDAGINR
jgi:hypothetical protein